jgi:hypothetical protein
LLRRGEGKGGKGWDGMGRGGKGRERRGGMGKGLGGSTASWLLGGMDATGEKKQYTLLLTNYFNFNQHLQQLFVRSFVTTAIE